MDTPLEPQDDSLDAAAAAVVSTLGPAPASEGSPGPDWSRGVDGKWYPPKPGRQRPPPLVEPIHRRDRRAFGVGGALAAVILLAVVAVLIAGIVATLRAFEDDESRNFRLPSEHAIGDTARTGDLDVTLNTATNPYTPAADIDAPPPGTHLLAAEITLHNASDTTDLVISSATQFDLTDANRDVQPVTLVSDLLQLDGPLAHGEVRHGFVVFRVTDNAAAPLELRVRGNLTAGGVIFKIP